MDYRNIWLKDLGDAPKCIDRIRYVCERLRDDDRREAYALKATEHPDVLVQHLMALLPAKIVFESIGSLAHSRTIALMGVWSLSPYVGAAAMVATDEFPAIAGDLARYVRRELIPGLKSQFRRIEVRALKGARDNCRFIECLGANFECELPLLGKDGQTFVQYAWTHHGDAKCASRQAVRQ